MRSFCEKMEYNHMHAHKEIHMLCLERWRIDDGLGRSPPIAPRPVVFFMDMAVMEQRFLVLGDQPYSEQYFSGQSEQHFRVL